MFLLSFGITLDVCQLPTGEILAIAPDGHVSFCFRVKDCDD